MGVVFVPVYIRYLGVEAYGLIGFFVVLQIWSVQLDAIIAPIVGREMARLRVRATGAYPARRLLRGVELIVGASAVPVALATWGGSNWIATHWLRAEATPIASVAAAISIMGFTVLLRSYESLYRGAAVGYGRQVAANATLAGIATVRGLGAVCILEWIAPTIVAFFLWQALASLLGALAALRLAYARLPQSASPGVSVAGLYPHRRFATGMLAITALAFLLTQVDKLLLSRLLSLEEYGVYFLSTILAGAAFGIVYPVTQVFFARFSALVATHDLAELKRSYHLGAQLITVAVVPFASLLAFNSTLVLVTWTRDHALAAKASMIVPALCLGSMLHAMMWIPYQLQLAYGHTRTAIRVNVVAVLLVVPAILYVAPRYGAPGAAWVWCSLNAGYLALGVNVMYRHFFESERARWYLNDVLGPMMAAGLVALASRVAMPEGLSTLPLLAWLGVSLLLSALAALGAAGVLRTAALEALLPLTKIRGDVCPPP